MTSSKIFIAGAGGLGREVLAVLQALGKPVSGFLVEDGFERGEIAGLPVYSNAVAWIEAQHIVLAIGDPRARRRLSSRLLGRSMTALHPSANIGPRVSIGAGSLIVGIVNITCDVSIGDHVLINPGCTIAHDCRIGSFSSLGPSVALAGNVTVGQGAILGTGAIVLPGCSIGDNATVGAGAVVVKDVSAGSTVYGIPATSKS
jgi:acetyltransferase EpsM